MSDLFFTCEKHYVKFPVSDKVSDMKGHFRGYLRVYRTESDNIGHVRFLNLILEAKDVNRTISDSPIACLIK